MEVYLYFFVNKKYNNQAWFLSMVKFAYNNFRNTSTG